MRKEIQGQILASKSVPQIGPSSTRFPNQGFPKNGRRYVAKYWTQEGYTTATDLTIKLAREWSGNSSRSACACMEGAHGSVRGASAHGGSRTCYTSRRAQDTQRHLRHCARHFPQTEMRPAFSMKNRARKKG